jgi:hypothetical protein
VIGRSGLKELQQLARDTGNPDLAEAFFCDALATVVPASGETDDNFWVHAFRTLLVFQDWPAVEQQCWEVFRQIEAGLEEAANAMQSQSSQPGASYPILESLVREVARRTKEKPHARR